MRHYGSGQVTWADALAPAIRFAEQGFPITGFRHAAVVRDAETLAQDPAARGIYLIDGRAPAEGATLRQPLLAETLRRLVRDGAMDFYTGAIAREIAADMQAAGGWITYDDLAQVAEPRVMAPVSTRDRGWDVYTLPPPAGGYAVLMALEALATAPARELAQVGTPRTRWLLRALRAAHASRREAPIRDLADPYGEVSARITSAHIRNLMRRRHGGETTHFTVVDASGMAVAVTQSIDSYFGARVAHPTLGFLYNNYMQSLERDDPTHPFALGPRTPPFSSMSATIVARDGQPHLALGSPGSARIISAVTQVTSHWIDVVAGVEAAVAAERVHVVPSNTAYLEQRDAPPDLLRAMGQDGFRLRRQTFGLVDNGLDPYFGGVHAVAREGAGWRGAADPRRDGAVGYAGTQPVE
jgi:gamma-glutamyltranspeptidase/glutathione hydrolase